MEKSGVVKVLGMWVSPFYHRVRIALNLKSVEYELVEQDLTNKSQLLLETNPIHKKIPVLIHNDKSICESQVIVQYIDDVWTTTNAPSFLPSDPYQRATARFWAEYVDDKLLPSNKALFMGMLNGEGAEKTKIALEEANQALAVLENAFVECSKGQKFFGGDKIGYVDIVFGSYLAWMKMVEKFANLSLIGESNTPNLFKWAQHFCAADAVKDVFPETDKLIEYAKSYAAKVVKKADITK